MIKGSDFGINFKKVKCPKCNSVQPRLRKPSSLTEALWGGYTCKECGCKMDKYGVERS